MRKTFFLALILACLLALAGSACAVTVLGVDIPDNAVSCSLKGISKLNDNRIPEVAEALNSVPTLTECDLSDTVISANGALTLKESCPQISFHFSLPIGKKRVDSELTTLDIDSLNTARDVKLKALMASLQCMPNLTHVIMYDCNFGLTDMDTLLNAFPDVDFEWTLRFNKIKVKNTATAFSTLKGRQNPRYTAEDLEPLTKYCPDLLALDVGHNNVYDLTFLSAWPHLKRLIVIDSQNPVTDLSPLADLMDLEYVELFMEGITDLSPLANHTQLLDLNVCHNDITDLTPLYSCTNLERLWISYNPNLTQEEIDAFKQALPNCIVETEVWSSTTAGWREHPRYFVMYDSFKSGVYEPFAEVTDWVDTYHTN